MILDGGARGVRRVAGALKAAGGKVFGWDIHWGLTWSFELKREVSLFKPRYLPTGQDSGYLS